MSFAAFLFSLFFVLFTAVFWLGVWVGRHPRKQPLMPHRTCLNCRYLAVDEEKYPCAECAYAGGRPKWEKFAPKTATTFTYKKDWSPTDD